MKRATASAETFSDAESFVDAYSSRLSPSPLPPDHGTILDEKRSRKQLEDDAMRLRNRVRTLLTEEQRVRKEMTRTETKIEQTMQIQEEKERRLFEKEVRKEIEKRQVVQRRETNAQARRDSRHVRLQKEAQIHEEKIRAARDTKREKCENRRMCVKDKDSELKRAQERKESVKQVEFCIKKKLQLHQSTKLTKAQKDYNKRLADERQARREKEQELEDLMRVELELIEKLKLKQEEQEKQYHRLKTCLGRTTKKTSRRKTGLLPTSAKSFATEERPRVHRVLQQFDRKGNGTFAASDLENVLRALNCRLEAEEIAHIQRTLESEERGYISQDRFLSWWQHDRQRATNEHSMS